VRKGGGRTAIVGRVSGVGWTGCGGCQAATFRVEVSHKVGSLVGREEGWMVGGDGCEARGVGCVVSKRRR